MIFQEKKSANAGPSCGTGEGVAHSKRWYVALVRMHHEKKVSERLSKMGILWHGGLLCRLACIRSVHSLESCPSKLYPVRE